LGVVDFWEVITWKRRDFEKVKVGSGGVRRTSGLGKARG
jgi:hypothetical protein